MTMSATSASPLNFSSLPSTMIVNSTQFAKIPLKNSMNLTTVEDLSPVGYSIAAVVLFFIMLLGCFNNLLVIIVVGGTKKLRTPMNSILLNLSVSDFIISAFGTPMSFASAVNRKWIFGEFLCEAYAFLMTLTGMTAIGTLAAIAIDRYIIISRSFRGQALSTVSATATIIVIWAYSLAQALPPLFGWNRYIVEHPGIACSLDWQTADTLNAAFIAYIFVLGYILPVAIMSFCYIKVIWIVKK
ncbi:melanopsin-like, partial [Stegodyphus dumicola]|uniref:melanopsin-like n=1 Tax=Stegodyphus dumicola TaxID=202533 RepID=UPI0015A8C64A